METPNHLGERLSEAASEVAHYTLMAIVFKINHVVILFISSIFFIYDNTEYTRALVAFLLTVTEYRIAYRLISRFYERRASRYYNGHHHYVEDSYNRSTGPSFYLHFKHLEIKFIFDMYMSFVRKLLDVYYYESGMFLYWSFARKCLFVSAAAIMIGITWAFLSNQIMLLLAPAYVAILFATIGMVDMYLQDSSDDRSKG